MTLHLLARLGLGLGAGLAALTAAVPPATAADWCDVPTMRSAATGALAIGEYGAFPSATPCPPLEQRLGGAFSYRRGDKLFMWFRLEGDSAYLRSQAARERIEVYFKRKRSFRTVPEYLDIGDALIDIGDAEGETIGKGGRFDWRFSIEFKAAIVPGVYVLALSQGGRQICHADGCDLVIEFRSPAQ